jgi:octaprenyl-diphosphate synthase
MNDDLDAIRHAVRLGIAPGKVGKIGLQFNTDHAAIANPRRQAKAHGANTRSEVEHAGAWRRRRRGRQEHGIHGDAIAAPGLPKSDAARQQRIFCGGRFHKGTASSLTTSCRNIGVRLGDYFQIMATVVSLEGKRKAPSLEPLLALCADDMARVDREIVARMRSPVTLIPELANHLVGAGGKRMRPLLTVAAARLCGYREPDDDRHVKLATCVEFIHSATLLHDDVVDVSALRRGKPTANSLWGDKASVLVGDFLFTRAFELMVDVGSLDILGVLSRASSTIAEGEVLQLVTQRDSSTPEATYLEVIKAKTAKLFAAAAEVGAMIAGRNGPERVALESFGMNLGIAFQLVDDALDYAGREAKLGKSVGDDFREGKITLPVILAFLRGGRVDREFWKRTLEKLDQRPDDLERAQSLIERHNALTDTLERARHYGAMARDALGLFGDSPLKDALLEAVDFAIDRAH